MGATQDEAGRFRLDPAELACPPQVGLRIPPRRESGARRRARAQAGTFIQIIETRWTSQSRSAPQAAIRNAVPMLFRTPVEGAQAPVLLHRALCCESKDFSPSVEPQVERFSAELAEQYRLAIHTKPQGVRVEFFGVPFSSDSCLASDSVVLSAGMWLRIIANRRLAIEDGWGYCRLVYNIAHCEPGAVNSLFAGTAPALCINRETQLW